MDLQKLANISFATIWQNTGDIFPHGTIADAFSSFQSITESRGLEWLIDATTGSGMTHQGWMLWMQEARKQLNY